MTIRGAPPSDLLLGRPEFAGDLHLAGDWVRGRRVMITGAAGSVGWPLAHCLRDCQPSVLTLLDHHEHSLFSLERSLGSYSDALQYELLDLRDRPRLERAFRRAAPDVVFHLAAAKHVPYGQRFPDGVVASNVLATDALLSLARDTGAETFVYPSSDKSVQPPSLYGATKRLCEALVQDEARRDGRRLVVVRFVNIIGTRGSVIETFSQQIQEDYPLSVTHAGMTRYWISMEEALWALLNAGRSAETGSIVLPACGEAVPVLETARRLAQWYAPAIETYPMTIVGIRPGERLHEVLLSQNETMRPGPAEGLTLVETTRDPACLDSVRSVVEELRVRVDDGDGAEISSLAMLAAEHLQ